MERFCYTCEVIMSELAMASPLTSYLKSVNIEEHLATAVQPREPGQKTMKQPTIFSTSTYPRPQALASTAIAYLSCGLFLR